MELGVTISRDKLGELLTEPVSVADQLPMTFEYGGVWPGLGAWDLGDHGALSYVIRACKVNGSEVR